MQLKVTRVGDSVGIVLPKELADKLQINQGDFLEIIETADGFTVKPYNAELRQQMEVAEKIMREDYNLLKRLAE
ncbi:MAG: AbrB/MazE/SpoVT family DNA-binding domain-containing protein [Cyanobacteria bacterium]|jgi:putative addiction module antidote|nr:AbrB/MazE/SpoVT family DNA-binding domain-containing protein [Cyanobacteria bacterium GSL.Bin1]